MTDYVLVHGAFADGWYWTDTARLLEEHGHTVHVAELPSTGREPSDLGDLADDVAEVRRLVTAAAGPVVLVGHSYGGLVLTELAADPGVAHSVYVSAFWPDRGCTVRDRPGGPLDWIVPTDDGTAVRVTDDVARAAEVLCADLPAARVPAWYANLRYSSTAALGARATAPDRTLPTTYVVLERDEALLAPFQEGLATRADRVERLDTAHVPQLTDPAGLAAVLARVPL